MNRKQKTFWGSVIFGIVASPIAFAGSTSFIYAAGATVFAATLCGGVVAVMVGLLVFCACVTAEG